MSSHGRRFSRQRGERNDGRPWHRHPFFAQYYSFLFICFSAVCNQKNNPRLRPIPDIAHGTHIIQEGRHITIIFYRVAHGTHIISRSYAFPGGVFARTYTYAHTHIAKHTHTNFKYT